MYDMNNVVHNKLLFFYGFSVLVALHSSGVEANEVTQYTVCDDPASHVLQIQRLDIRPKPIVLPGEITVDIVVNTTAEINGPVALNVSIAQRENSGSPWVDLSCQAFGVEWCDIDDVCQLLKTTGDDVCPDYFRSAGLPCKCPLLVSAGQYAFQDLQFDLFLFARDQEIRLQVYFASGNTTLTCLQLELDIKSFFD